MEQHYYTNLDLPMAIVFRRKSEKKGDIYTIKHEKDDCRLAIGSDIPYNPPNEWESVSDLRR